MHPVKTDTHVIELLNFVRDRIWTISGSVRNTATLLEVLVATKIALLAGLDPQAPDLPIAVWQV